MLTRLAAEGVPSSILSEHLLREWVDLLVRLVEAAGALIIFVGAVLAAVAFVRAALVSRFDLRVRARATAVRGRGSAVSDLAADATYTAALLCAVLALVCAATVLARTRSLGQALPVLLALLMAAGLLRLTSDAGWEAITTAAAVVGLRELVVAHGLRPAQ